MDPRRLLIDQTRTSRFDTAEGFIELPKLAPNTVPRSGTIRVSSVETSTERAPSEQRFFIHLDGPAFELDKSQPAGEGAVGFDAIRLLSYVNDCRKAWQSVVDSERPRKGLFSRKEKPLLESVTQDEEMLTEATKKLAVAGRTLFNHVFAGSRGNMPAALKHLKQALCGPPCFLTVYSDSFFIPWQMLYVDPPGQPQLGPNGENADPNGFLGYRHVIEQATDNSILPPPILPTEEGIAFGFTFDASIDLGQTTKTIRSQKRYFQRLSQLQPRAERCSKDELRLAFMEHRLPDQISYFYLHGRTSDAGTAGTPPLFFIGRDSISANDIKGWLQYYGLEPALPTNPFMIFNACQSGQLRSLFYESFAFKLLDLRARGLLGPQIDIPSIFAQEYARRFFDRLLSQNTGHNDQKPSIEGRIGGIVRQLVQEFYDQDKNPLGLVYSLYKGADSYVSWPTRP